MESLLRAIELRPESAAVWSNAAALAAVGGDAQQARAAVRNALALDPSNPDVQRNARLLAIGDEATLGYLGGRARKPSGRYNLQK